MPLLLNFMLRTIEKANEGKGCGDSHNKVHNIAKVQKNLWNKHNVWFIHTMDQCRYTIKAIRNCNSVSVAGNIAPPKEVHSTGDNNFDTLLAPIAQEKPFQTSGYLQS